MEIAIDLSANRWSIDGAPAHGKRRWEAALLALLLRDQHHHAGVGCSGAKLHVELAALGQAQPLNRKQIGRLMDGLHDAFVAIGQTPALALRLGHAPRGRTVGPWWWEPQPTDTWSLVGPRAEPKTNMLAGLPGLATVPNATANAALCSKMLVCYGHIADGDVTAALEQLDALGAAPSHTVELRALLLMRRTEALLSMRNLPLATRALDDAQALLHGRGQGAAYLAGQMLMLRHRLHYAASPMVNYGAITQTLGPLALRPPGSGFPEVDVTARSALLNLLALCERRWLEEHGANAPKAQAALRMERAQRYWFAALFGYLAINNHEFVQHMCANLAYFYQRMSQLGIGYSARDALAWYALARGWHNRFDLADNVVWEYIFLGDYWLYDTTVRAAFRRDVNTLRWRGHRPDELAFYAFAETRAAEIGEPRQMAHTSLNLFHFARGQSNLKLSQEAKKRLHGVLDAHPDVRAILAAEGYRIP